MKKYIAIVSLSLLGLSCNKQHSLAMKSADKEFILNTANEFYAQKKWSKALSLYDRLPNLVAGTNDAPEVVFRSAYANYYDKNYKLAGHQFRSFSHTFVKDPRREEAAYMSAICYFEDSNEYNLDQSSTEMAINNLQDFLNNYPNSERAKDINEKIESLTTKLEKKYYEHAKQYFKMGDYRASVTAFENLLEDYPSTIFKQQSMDYIMRGKYELGMHSVFDLKKDRLENAIAFSRQVEKDYPETSSTKEALQMRNKLLKELEKHLEILK
ncbi:MAG: outer membrane protein assembly factor BamD [Flavobacteriaceae bacterium]|nr:outer membrane protein assembly factor BamD [Flavobacteriaceae bacterium]